MKRVRVLLSVFILLLALSGITAFPLVTELHLLAGAVQAVNWAPDGLRHWILLVERAITETSVSYPFLAYGTDWLAFGHLVIALFFIGPLQDPIRNVWIIHAGLIACVGVLPLALICGPIRGIPFYWQLIDCSFGVLGFLLLWYILKLIRRLELKPAGTS